MSSENTDYQSVYIGMAKAHEINNKFINDLKFLRVAEQNNPMGEVVAHIQDEAAGIDPRHLAVAYAEMVWRAVEGPTNWAKLVYGGTPDITGDFLPE